MPNSYGRILNDRAHAHAHHGDCDSNHGHDEDPALRDSLFSKVNTEFMTCLNEKNGYSGAEILKPFDQRMDMTKFLESDSDKEFMLHVPFTGMVKLKSIVVWGGPGNCAPKNMKLIVNRQDVDFTNVHNTLPTQEIDLVQGSNAPVEYALRASKFSNVSTLNLHFNGNFSDCEDDEIQLFYIAFYGEFFEVNTSPVVAVYESRPNFADHIQRTKIDFSLNHIH
ncbi:PITH domain-containing protein [Smittium mucronatum]|uniref:PITH domain-containing protein n=1 Tax=Smittium mucronatum TaxID=133383 RepID=A0A1R0H990_9FUNG|nr:PITH domain-containing protein [Smittium mucronatum]